MSNARWTQEEKDFILSNINKLTVDQMSESIGKSTMSVTLFLHRQRLTAKGKDNSILKQMLQLKFGKPEYFSPTRDFYNDVDISQKRWWDLFHGRKSITEKEYIKLCETFNITLEEAFESRQLKLFGND